MKKVVLGIILMIVLSISVNAAETHHVRLETNPAGREACAEQSGERCTFTTSGDDFVFWNITGDYEIISGDYQEHTFTIKPLSDIKAVATFEDGMPHTAIPGDNPLAPKTGDEDEVAAVAILIVSIFIVLSLSVVCLVIK